MGEGEKEEKGMEGQRGKGVKDQRIKGIKGSNG
jgi:hypothetical protein